MSTGSEQRGMATAAVCGLAAAGAVGAALTLSTETSSPAGAAAAAGAGASSMAPCSGSGAPVGFFPMGEFVPTTALARHEARVDVDAMVPQWT